MRKKIEIESWDRKNQFKFFKDFDEPFWGITAEVDCTVTYQMAKEKGISFYLSYLHKSLIAVNSVEAFRYRMEGDDVFLYDTVGASATVMRENGTFGFSYIEFYKKYEDFASVANIEFERVKNNDDLIPGSASTNVVHYSSLPWIKFTGLSHARDFKRQDTAPKISFGKMTTHQSKKMMPVSIHVHHALVDGLHVGQHLEAFQDLLNKT